MIEDGLRFYRTPGTMTELPDRLGIGETPSDLDELRGVVQGILVHRDWALAYGLTNDTIRLDEPNLRSTAEVLTRLFEISDEPVTVARPPVDRVLGICRHFTLLHTAAPAFARCAGACPVRVQQLLRPDQLGRPLDHRAVGRRRGGCATTPRSTTCRPSWSTSTSIPTTSRRGKFLTGGRGLDRGAGRRRRPGPVRHLRHVGPPVHLGQRHHRLRRASTRSSCCRGTPGG